MATLQKIEREAFSYVVSNAHALAEKMKSRCRPLKSCAVVSYPCHVMTT
jgi:hypothetical protein